MQIEFRIIYATCMSDCAEEVHVYSVERSQVETDLQPFRQEGVESGAGSWRTGTKYALATGLTSLCSARRKLRQGKFNLRMSGAYL